MVDFAKAKTLLTGLWLSVALLAAAPALAQHNEGSKATPQLSDEQAHRANAIARNTMSPFCPGRTLADCPSSNAAEWREDIRRWVAEGLSAQQIRKHLEDRVDGGTLSGSPSTSLGWGLPVIVAVVAVGLLAVVLRRVSNPKRTFTPVSRSAKGQADPDVDAELDGVDEEQEEADVGAEEGSGGEHAVATGGPPPADDEELEQRLKRELEREDI